jgi:hypothetical protein
MSMFVEMHRVGACAGLGRKILCWPLRRRMGSSGFLLPLPRPSWSSSGVAPPVFMGDVVERVFHVVWEIEIRRIFRTTL